MEAKYPALLFKQQLDAFVLKIFPMIRDNVRKEISPMLSNCVQTPEPSTHTAKRLGSTSAGGQAAGERSRRGSELVFRAGEHVLPWRSAFHRRSH